MLILAGILDHLTFLYHFVYLWPLMIFVFWFMYIPHKPKPTHPQHPRHYTTEDPEPEYYKGK